MTQPTGDNVVLRPLAPTDEDALASLFERNDTPDTRRRFDPFPLTRATARDLCAHGGRDGYYVAERDGRIVGLSMLRGLDDGWDVPSFGIVVDRECHGRGVGGRLTDYTIERARADGAPKVRLSVYASNEVAASMYMRRGFVEESREVVHREAGEMTRLVMLKELEPEATESLDVARTGGPEERRTIPVAEPALVGREKELVEDCIDSTWISSTGPYIGRFESGFADVCGVEHAISCANGTVALHLALLALGIGPGDEVVCPTLTYVAAANSIVYCGATPVLVDAEATTWNLDPAAVEASITPRTKAILVVHLYGHPADMDAIRRIADIHRLHVVEDAAEALGARHRGRPVGSLSDVATFSFYGNKVITTGEGGMVVTDDSTLAERMRVLRGQGQDPLQRYRFPVVGYNYRLTNVACAIGCAQLEKVEWHVGRRRQIAGWYRELLGDRPGIAFSPEAEWATSSFWMSSVVLEGRTADERDSVMGALQRKGVETRPFFYPMHTLPPHADDRPFPVADALAAGGINLPSGASLSYRDAELVVERLLESVSDLP
jgi:perosamine synthetase